MREVIGRGLLLVIGIALGLVAYEVLARFAMPKEYSAPMSRGEKDTGTMRDVGIRGDSKRPGFKSVLASLSRVLERFAPLARSESEVCRDRLERAGLTITPGTWRSLRVVSTALGGLAACSVLIWCAQMPLGIRVILLGGGLVGGWSVPSLILSGREKRRRFAIEARLPDAMELLGIAIAAGSPVEQCFHEVAASLDGPLADEFALVDQEVNLLGHTREAALENFGQRCRSSEVRAFVAQLTQAVSQGTSIAESLANQAKLSRDTAQADALERIRKMPTKLDVVLSLCFLPPTVALVVVPTVVNLLEFLHGTMA